jgi:hypothetical protein
MNELHKEEAGGSPTVQNTAKLFEPNGPRRYELPETWESQKRKLRPHRLIAWYSNVVYYHAAPRSEEPHSAIFSDRLRRYLPRRAADLHSSLWHQQAVASSGLRAQLLDTRHQLDSCLARLANEATSPLDYLLWSTACNVAHDVYVLEWCTADEAANVDRFSHGRLHPLFTRVYHELMVHSTAFNLQQHLRRDPNKPCEVGDWVTNHPKGLQSFWPRRKGVKYFESVPMPSFAHTSQALLEQGNVGIYLAADVDSYFQMPQARPQDE